MKGYSVWDVSQTVFRKLHHLPFLQYFHHFLFISVTQYLNIATSRYLVRNIYLAIFTFSQLEIKKKIALT